ncbi:MAG: hypothetical protein LBQ84_09070 [Flavobacteriaceae bacterium]|jgi:hypothetical protein|nr:hypothetical protein [Flavobacteriaceae bacterium]
MSNTKNKLWIFQSNRTLSPFEEERIYHIITDFLHSWASHGADLKSEFQILDHKFIIVSVDEAQAKATGCSIDSLNRCIRQIDAEYHLDLLNRLWVSYETEKGEIETLPMDKFKEKIRSAQLSPDTFVYNLSVSTPDEFYKKFKQPLKESWAKVYLN